MKALWIAIVIVLAGGAYAFWHHRLTHAAPTAVATFVCDGGKAITAAFYEGKSKAVKPGEMPQPGGWVEVSMGGASTTTLKQTVSGSGVRYANSDESLVFWNKGNEALIMRNNAMDLTYTNCQTH